MLTRRRFHSIALAVPGLALAQRSPTPDALADRLRAGGCAVLWRHAQTESGIGDPPGFKLDQCSTQRNLSEQGRAQARTAAAWFASRKLVPRAVRSSAWCRCQDTADLAFGQHEVWAPLNSFFDDRGAAEGSRSAMLQRLKEIPVGAFEVWVTHQVNITGVTGEGTSMGEALVVDGGRSTVARGVLR